MLASEDIVHALIPQGEPMIMVDTLLEHDEHHSITGFNISKDNIFARDLLFTEEGLIENMAQSAALRTGWMAKQKQDGDVDFRPPIGVIGAIKNFKPYRLPKCGSRITTEVIIQAEIMNATLVMARIFQDEELLAEGELKIFLQE